MSSVIKASLTNDSTPSNCTRFTRHGDRRGRAPSRIRHSVKSNYTLVLHYRVRGTFYAKLLTDLRRRVTRGHIKMRFTWRTYWQNTDLLSPTFLCGIGLKLWVQTYLFSFKYMSYENFDVLDFFLQLMQFPSISRLNYAVIVFINTDYNEIFC